MAVAESLLSYKLHALLGDFVERAPAVKIQLHSLNCHDIREGILSGQYDLGVYYDVGGHPHTLEVLPLGQAKGIIVASPLLAPGLRDFDTSHQRKETSFIINEPRSIYRERMEAHLRSRDILFRNTRALEHRIHQKDRGRQPGGLLPADVCRGEGTGCRKPDRTTGTHVRPSGPGHLRLA